MTAAPHVPPFRALSGEGAVGPYLGAIRAHKLLVLGVTLVTVLASLIWLQAGSPEYKASSQLLVQPMSQEDDDFLGLTLLRDSGDPTRTVQTAAELVGSPQAAAATARRLGEGWTTEEVLDAVEVEPQGQSNILALTATADAPSEAARIANQFARASIGQRNAELRRQIDAELPRLRQQLETTPPDSTAAAELAARIDRWESLSTKGDPTIALSQLATPPRDATGAGALLVIPLAILAGLALGSGTAMLLELFDRRIRDEAELLSLYPLPVLVRVPTLPRRVRQRLGSAVWHMPPAVHEAFRTILVQLELGSVAERPRRLMVTSASTGDGKTTSAINLAMSIASSGHQVILVDLDLRKPDIAASLGLGPGHPLPELLRPDITDLLSPVQGAPNLRVLSTIPGPGDAALVDALDFHINHLLDEAAAQVDFVVVDTPPLGEVADALRFAGAVDATILVARPGRTHRRNFEFTRDLLERADATPIGYLLIGAGQSASGSYYHSYGVNAPRSLRPFNRVAAGEPGPADGDRI